jgi:hypothetical protein
MLTQFVASLTGRLVVAALVLAVLVFGITQWRGARNSARQVRVSEGQAGAVAESAADAIQAVDSLHARDTRSDDLTRENSYEIRNAPGADAPVGDGVHSAGVDSLCRRAAYRGSERCLQRSIAPAMAESRAGSPAP